MRKASLPSTHPDHGKSQENIGRALAGLGRNKEAAALENRAKKIRGWNCQI